MHTAQVTKLISEIPEVIFHRIAEWHSQQLNLCLLPLLNIVSIFLCMCLKVILQERESRRQKFLQDVMNGHIESHMLRYMPALKTDYDDGAVNSDPSTAVSSEQSAADAAVDAVDLNLSSAAKRAMLLARIHSRRFREWVVISCKIFYQMQQLLFTNLLMFWNLLLSCLEQFMFLLHVAVNKGCNLMHFYSLLVIISISFPKLCITLFRLCHMLCCVQTL